MILGANKTMINTEADFDNLCDAIAVNLRIVAPEATLDDIRLFVFRAPQYPLELPAEEWTKAFIEEWNSSRVHVPIEIREWTKGFLESCANVPFKIDKIGLMRIEARTLLKAWHDEVKDGLISTEQKPAPRAGGK